jgi:hypothetical protein
MVTAQKFADAIKKGEEQEVIDWCNEEIKEYKTLIEILEKRVKNK